jgi:hypothetical protein
MSSRPGEEARKAQALEAALARSDGAFRPASVLSGSEHARLARMLQQDVFQPSADQVLAATSFIETYARAGRIRVLIPIRELHADLAPVIDRTIGAISSSVGVENVFVSENGMHPEVRRTVVDRGAQLIPVEAVRRRFDLPALLEVLGLETLEFGLGMSVFWAMAYFALEGTIRPDDWVVKLDADIRNFEDCLLLNYLFSPAVSKPEVNWDYLKIGAVGRNNEAVLAAVNGLLAWFAGGPARRGPDLAPHARVAQEIYESCIRQVWLLSGQYALRWRAARSQLSATGYCDPLLVSIQQGWRTFAQVLNPHPVADMPNTKRKEDGLMTRVVQLLNALVVFQRSLRSGWTIDEVARFNREVARHLEQVVWIPEEPGPLRVDSTEADRVFPTIETLLEEGLLQ